MQGNPLYAGGAADPSLYDPALTQLPSFTVLSTHDETGNSLPNAIPSDTSHYDPMLTRPIQYNPALTHLGPVGYGAVQVVPPGPQYDAPIVLPAHESYMVLTNASSDFDAYETPNANATYEVPGLEGNLYRVLTAVALDHYSV
jgi:hypothetical protein